MTRPGAAASAGAVLLLAAALLVPALANGFPLIFPDSGTYLGVAFGPEYAIDRSSAYGLLLKPIVTAVPGLAGLWTAIAVQALIIAAILLAAARALRPGASAGTTTLWLLPVVALTALPWHAGQFMPDAFTGPLVLTTWLLLARPPGANGTVLLWAATAMMASSHYTHPVLVAVAAIAGLAGFAVAGDRRGLLRRAAAPLLAAAAAVGVMIALNGLAIGRWTMSPVGSAFLFARLNEDGLIRPWLDATCSTRPNRLCTERDRMPADSQKMLWGDGSSVVERHIWHGTPADRWAWAKAMGEANRGAIALSPVRFFASSARGGLHQFISFRAIDDECPVGCGSPISGIGQKLIEYRPETNPVLQASGQRQGTTPKSLVRAITTPIAALALLLLPVAGAVAWRRRDSIALALVSALTAALVANAAMAGALSDVHDRYQSRVVWLAPMILLLLALRWRRSADRL